VIELSFYCNGTLPIARRLRAKPKEQCHEKHEKNIHNPGRVVARRGACQQRFMGANQTRSVYLFF
jgi:hypothetical protein